MPFFSWNLGSSNKIFSNIKFHEISLKNLWFIKVSICQISKHFGFSIYAVNIIEIIKDTLL